MLPYCLIPGLKKSPTVLQDTMATNINPERLAASEVQVNGGYDPCLFRVGRIVRVISDCFFRLFYISSGRTVPMSRL